MPAYKAIDAEVRLGRCAELLQLRAEQSRLGPRRRERPESANAGHRFHEFRRRRRPDRRLHHRELTG